MKKRKKYIIPIFVPQQGCRFQCIYCNQYAITGVHSDAFSEAKKVLEQAVLNVPKNMDIEVEFYGGTFTAMEEKLQKELLELTRSYKEILNITAVRLSTRPDFIDSHILDMLASYDVTAIELGAQSMNDEVLRMSGRGHLSSDVENAACLIKEHGFQLGVQLMIGLPGDEFAKDIESAFRTIELGADFVRIYPTLVIKDTPLERLYLNGKYKPLSLCEAVDICSEMLCIYNVYKIPVIRIGLQPSDDIQLGRDVLAGPFHPAFGELVKSKLYLKAVEHFFMHAEFAGSQVLNLYANPREISIIVGQKRSNLAALEKLGILKTNIISSCDVEAGNIVVENERCRYNLNIKDYCCNRFEELYGRNVS